MRIVEPEIQGFSSEKLLKVSKIMGQYVDEGKVAGTLTMVARKGDVVHLDKCGYQNIAKKIPIEFDTLFRIYSMTKPITSVAMMMLFEDGFFQLEDPVSKYLPEFKDLKVMDKSGNLIHPREEITVKHLLTHTAGLGYNDDPENDIFDRLTVQADLENIENTSSEFIKRIAKVPLRFHPGDSWHYSYATDVVGCLVETLSGMTLGDFFAEKIFKPLGIEETFFRIPDNKVNRFSELYGLNESEQLGIVSNDIGGDFYKEKRNSGGAGLISNWKDYYRFAQFLMNKGELDGVRLLEPKTVELMRTNHLSPNLLPIIMEEKWMGIGFGLGFSVIIDASQSEQSGSVGSHGWGGWASTNFWIDPVKEIIGILLLQCIPSGTFTIRNDFRDAVYKALID